MDCSPDNLQVDWGAVPDGKRVVIRAYASAVEPGGSGGVKYENRSTQSEVVNGRKRTKSNYNSATSAEAGGGGGGTKKVSVGNFVWEDRNRDGIQDEGEPGIEGVELTLTGPDGGQVTDVNGDPVGPIRTDANGAYLFANLPVLKAGESYTVTVSGPPAGYDPTVAEQGGHPELDSSTGSASSGDLTSNGARDETLDFGFVRGSVAVGDYVWFDTNRNGIQDDGEPGIEDVELTLTGPGGEQVTDVFGNPVGPVRTDSDGAYRFAGLPVLQEGQSYTVTVSEAPADYVPTQAGQGGRDTDSSTGSAQSQGLTESGAEDTTLDFGFVTPAVSVGDFVWSDTDTGGIQDDGEPGIEGVVLAIRGPDGGPVTNVLGEEVGEVTTDAQGRYSFDNLPVLEEGQSYTVTVQTPDGYRATTAGAGDDRGADSSTDTAESTGLTENGQRDATLDFGFVELPDTVSVGDFVWFDVNRNGQQDDGEPGLQRFTMVLTGPDGGPVTDVDGNLVGPLTTDETGHYQFTNLPILQPGETYTVTVTPLALYVPTEANQGDPTTDSSTGSAESRSLVADGEVDDTLDFGFYRPSVSVGDFVWHDVNKNGIQDDGEPGIEGVELTITDPDGNPVTDVFGNPVPPQRTDENGAYLFEFLPTIPSGFYTVRVTDPPAGFAPTQAGAGDDRGQDSSTGSEQTLTLTTDGASDLTIDFGFIKPAVSVGDYVWEDIDRDGIQDDGEPGIEGVELTVVGPDGEPVTNTLGEEVGPTTTDADGKYLFANLPALPAGQHYTVRVTAPERYVATVEERGDNRGVDSSTGSAESGDLTTDGASDPTLDFGFYKAAVTVGDRVWVDANRDGLQDEGGRGIEGVELTVVGPDGNPITDVFGHPVQPVLSDETGHYRFHDLPALPAGQRYTVRVTATPSGYAPTQAGVGDNRAIDSSTGSAESTDLTEHDQVDDSLDFGFVIPPVSVGDRVWRDTNRDGIQDDGEPGIEGVELTLTGPDGKPVTDIDGNTVGPVRTDANGQYLFSNIPALPAGQSYTVTVSRGPSGLVPTKAGAGSDRAMDSSTGSATSGDVDREGASDTTLDFGFVPPAVTIGDRVWLDRNGNGIQDKGESGIEGVVLTLTGPDGKPVTDVLGNTVGPVTTDANGKYLFANLPSLPKGQSYTVTVTRGPDGLVPTKAGAGKDRGADSSSGSATSGDVSADGATDLSLDFGFRPPVSAVTILKDDGEGNAADTKGAAARVYDDGTMALKLTVSNTGDDDLTDVTVTDTVRANGTVTALTCDWSKVGGPRTGTTWAGPLKVGASVECTAELTGVQPGTVHEDVATVTGTGALTKRAAAASNPYFGYVADGIFGGNPAGDGPLADTGATIGGIILAALLLLAAGVALTLAKRRRNRATMA